MLDPSIVEALSAASCPDEECTSQGMRVELVLCEPEEPEGVAVERMFVVCGCGWRTVFAIV